MRPPLATGVGVIYVSTASPRRLTCRAVSLAAFTALSDSTTPDGSAWSLQLPDRVPPRLPRFSHLFKVLGMELPFPAPKPELAAEHCELAAIASDMTTTSPAVSASQLTCEFPSPESPESSMTPAACTPQVTSEVPSPKSLESSMSPAASPSPVTCQVPPLELGKLTGSEALPDAQLATLAPIDEVCDDSVCAETAGGALKALVWLGRVNVGHRHSFRQLCRTYLKSEKEAKGKAAVGPPLDWSSPAQAGPLACALQTIVEDFKLRRLTGLDIHYFLDRAEKYINEVIPYVAIGDLKEKFEQIFAAEFSAMKELAEDEPPFEVAESLRIETRDVPKRAVEDILETRIIWSTLTNRMCYLRDLLILTNDTPRDFIAYHSDLRLDGKTLVFFFECMADHYQKHVNEEPDQASERLKEYVQKVEEMDRAFYDYCSARLNTIIGLVDSGVSFGVLETHIKKCGEQARLYDLLQCDIDTYVIDGDAHMAKYITSCRRGRIGGRMEHCYWRYVTSLIESYFYTVLAEKEQFQELLNQPIAAILEHDKLVKYKLERLDVVSRSILTTPPGHLCWAERGGYCLTESQRSAYQAYVLRMMRALDKLKEDPSVSAPLMQNVKVTIDPTADLLTPDEEIDFWLSDEPLPFGPADEKVASLDSPTELTVPTIETARLSVASSGYRGLSPTPTLTDSLPSPDWPTLTLADSLLRSESVC